MQTVTRGARGNESRQIAIQLLLARFFALQVARKLAANRSEQAPISLIEAFAQAQKQRTDGPSLVVHRHRDRFHRINLA
jgi:hypothetical protein